MSEEIGSLKKNKMWIKKKKSDKLYIDLQAQTKSKNGFHFST